MKSCSFPPRRSGPAPTLGGCPPDSVFGDSPAGLSASPSPVAPSPSPRSPYPTPPPAPRVPRHRRPTSRAPASATATTPRTPPRCSGGASRRWDQEFETGTARRPPGTPTEQARSAAERHAHHPGRPRLGHGRGLARRRRAATADHRAVGGAGPRRREVHDRHAVPLHLGAGPGQRRRQLRAEPDRARLLRPGCQAGPRLGQHAPGPLVHLLAGCATCGRGPGTPTPWRSPPTTSRGSSTPR